MARGVKRGVGTMPASAGCMSIRCFWPSAPSSWHSVLRHSVLRHGVMAHLEESRQAPWETAIVRPVLDPPRLLRRLTWRETAFIGALAAVAGGLAIALRRRGPVARPRARRVDRGS